MLKSMSPSLIFLVSGAPGPEVTYWMSVKPSARSSSSAMYCGALQRTGIFFAKRTLVVSSAPSAASTGGARRRPAALAIDKVDRNRRLVCLVGITNASLRLQLAFELVEKAPIGSIGDDLLRARFNETRLAHPQRVEPQRVLGVVFAPFVVGVVVQRLQRVVVTLGETAIDEPPRGARRIAGAQIGGLQDRPQHPFARDRVHVHELAIAGQQAAE